MSTLLHFTLKIYFLSCIVTKFLTMQVLGNYSKFFHLSFNFCQVFQSNKLESIEFRLVSFLENIRIFELKKLKKERNSKFCKMNECYCRNEIIDLQSGTKKSLIKILILFIL